MRKRHKPLGIGDRVWIKSSTYTYHPFPGYINRNLECVQPPQDEIGVISQVIVLPAHHKYQGKQLIVDLSIGQIDLYPSQDMFSYRRVLNGE